MDIKNFFKVRVLKRYTHVMKGRRRPKADKNIVKILSGDKVELVPQLAGGLCNRFRTLLAIMVNQEINSYLWDPMFNGRLGLEDNLDTFFDHSNLNMIVMSGVTESYQSWFMPFPITDKKNDVYILDSLNYGGLNGRFDPSQEHWFINSLKKVFWDDLSPKKEYLDLLSDITDKPYAVIHIRDWEYNDDLDSIVKIDNFERAKFLISPKVCERNLVKLIDLIDDNLDVFVLSYDRETVRSVSKLSNRIREFPILHEQQIIQDFIEFLFLCQAKNIIGSRYSTFTHLAGVLSNECTEYSLFD